MKVKKMEISKFSSFSSDRIFNALIRDEEIGFDLKLLILGVFLNIPKQELVPENTVSQEKIAQLNYSIFCAFLEYPEKAGETLNKWADQILNELPDRFIYSIAGNSTK